MLSEINYSEIKHKCTFIDVRSPQEFNDGAIPNAVNIPILDDEERKIVGTAYKQLSKNEARRFGVELVSPKILNMFDRILELKKLESYIVVYCARGGYRSTAFASIFSSIGINLFKLTDGYKGYRKYISETLPKLSENIKYIVVHGNTGVGKTDILIELKKMGHNILDLEAAANHRGSLLGSIGIGECNSQKTFETNIYEQLNYIDDINKMSDENFEFSDNKDKEKSIEKAKYVFIEAESKKIGKVVIPDYIFTSMNSGIHIFIDADLDYRAISLKKDYVLNENWIEESAKAIEALRKYLSNEKVDYLLTMLEQSNFEEVAKELMINYYDPMYMNKANAYEYAAKFKAEISAVKTAEDIVKWIEKGSV
jgi:tRNA 2-selenouridine synthase